MSIGEIPGTMAGVCVWGGVGVGLAVMSKAGLLLLLFLI